MAAARSQLRKRGNAKGKSAKVEPGSASSKADDAKTTDDSTRNKQKEGKEDEQEYEIVYKNGKAYRKLKDLPDVGYLITYGLPGQEGKSTRDPTRPW